MKQVFKILKNDEYIKLEEFKKQILKIVIMSIWKMFLSIILIFLFFDSKILYLWKWKEYFHTMHLLGTEKVYVEFVMFRLTVGL